MTTETDDLSYYETELPKVIAGVRRGEKWEYRDGSTWLESRYQSLFNLKEFLIYHPTCRVRLAPVPVVKTWDSVEDFPLDAYWLRERDTGNIYRIEGCTGGGVVYSSRGNWPKVMEWDELERFDWAPMGAASNWKPCVKPEGGK